MQHLKNSCYVLGGLTTKSSSKASHEETELHVFTDILGRHQSFPILLQKKTHSYKNKSTNHYVDTDFNRIHLNVQYNLKKKLNNV